MPRKTAALALALLGGAAVFVAPATAQDIQLATLTTTASSSTGASPSYTPWTQFMSSVAQKQRGRHLIAYEAIDGNIERWVDAYVDSLAKTDPAALTRDEQLAYWLNLRNAMVVQALIEGDRRNLIEARGTLEQPGVAWARPLVSVGGEQLSVAQIERDIILPAWSDQPNVIYGLYQGGKEGPALGGKPFDAGTVTAQLARMGRDFASDKNAVRIKGSTAKLSAFYDRYDQAVFGGDQSALVSHAAAVGGHDASKAAAVTKVEYRKAAKRAEEFKIRRQPQNGLATGAAGGGGGGGGYGS